MLARRDVFAAAIEHSTSPFLTTILERMGRKAIQRSRRLAEVLLKFEKMFSRELLLVVLVVRIGLPLDPTPAWALRLHEGFDVVDHARALDVLVGLDGHDEIRRMDRVVVAGPSQRAGIHVEIEHPNTVGVLVCGDEPLSTRVELEMPRRHAARMKDPN